jgi:ankyrin repeat protein
MQGLTVLCCAADRGYLGHVRLLVDKGADLNIADNEQQTALDYAVLCEHEDVEAYLRDRGALEGISLNLK